MMPRPSSAGWTAVSPTPACTIEALIESATIASAAARVWVRRNTIGSGSSALNTR
ncbi:hypothetical protein GL305_22580 [Nocardia seriolae]|nr:hypothetical protein [Nocardia seriolae]